MKSTVISFSVGLSDLDFFWTGVSWASLSLSGGPMATVSDIGALTIIDSVKVDASLLIAVS